MDRGDFSDLEHRESLLHGMVGKKTIIKHVLLTTFGLKKNKYSDIFSSVVTLDDLFAR